MGAHLYSSGECICRPSPTRSAFHATYQIQHVLCAYIYIERELRAYLFVHMSACRFARSACRLARSGVLIEEEEEEDVHMHMHMHMHMHRHMHLCIYSFRRHVFGSASRGQPSLVGVFVVQ